MNVYSSLPQAGEVDPQRRIGIGSPGSFSVYRWSGREYNFSYHVGPAGIYGWTMDRVNQVLGLPVEWVEG